MATWTQAQRKKFLATAARKRAQRKTGTTSIPLDAIPQRPAPAPKQSAPPLKLQFALEVVRLLHTILK